MTTLANKIQDVFNEPGCGINQGKAEKERKKGCTKPLQPGGAAGGCAFDGAKIALQPITDVAHLVNQGDREDKPNNRVAKKGTPGQHDNLGRSDSTCEIISQRSARLQVRALPSASQSWNYLASHSLV